MEVNEKDVKGKNLQFVITLALSGAGLSKRNVCIQLDESVRKHSGHCDINL